LKQVDAAVPVAAPEMTTGVIRRIGLSCADEKRTWRASVDETTASPLEHYDIPTFGPPLDEALAGSAEALPEQFAQLDELLAGRS
jgi:hypothetical protein